MKTNKLFATLLTVALSTAMFMSCGTGGRSSAITITISDVVNAPSNIATVMFTVEDEIIDEDFVLAVSEWTEGSTTQMLSDVPESFLVPVVEGFFLTGLSFSDERARISTNVHALALDSNGLPVGSLEIDEIIGNRRFIANWRYVDRDVTIRRTDAVVSVDLSLKKGWNVIYTYINFIDLSRVVMTTERPSEMNMEWTFLPLNRSVETVEMNNVVNASDNIDMIGAFTSETHTTVVSGIWENNGATLEFSQAIDASLLVPVRVEFEGLETDNPNARILSFVNYPDFFAFDENLVGLGIFEFSDSNRDIYTSWIFADRNVTVRGRRARDVYIDLHLHRGWNMYYIFRVNNNGESIFVFITQRPSGANLEWRFIPFSNIN